jgi:tRNA1(Val) A37 N6-methylase TrmN6
MAAVMGFSSGEAASSPALGFTSADTLFGGNVVLHQPAKGAGYRANVDALLLASFAAGGARSGRARVAFDLGAGAGAVALALLHLDAVERVVMIELDADAAELARRNLDANSWRAVGEVLRADVREAAWQRKGEADLVVCNPPYVQTGHGRAPRVPARARARTGDLGAFVEAARMLCGRRARACFVYPANEMATLVAALRGAGLEPKRLRAVHPTEAARARIVLVEAQPGKAGGLSVMAPLVERHAGEYTAEVAAILER